MRYSTKTLLLGFIFIAIVFAGFRLYERNWKLHCKNLEPSLFAFVLQGEIDMLRKAIARMHLVRPEVKIFLSLGLNEKLGEWALPSDKLLEEIGIQSVVSVDGIGEIGEEYVVHYIENVRWNDWDAVTLDFGWDGGARYGAERRGMKLLLIDDKWQIDGQVRIKTFRDPKGAE